MKTKHIIFWSQLLLFGFSSCQSTSMEEQALKWEFPEVNQNQKDCSKVRVGQFQSETVTISRDEKQHVIRLKTTGAIRNFRIIRWVTPCVFLIMNEENQEQIFLISINECNLDFYTYTLNKLDPASGKIVGQPITDVHLVVEKTVE